MIVSNNIHGLIVENKNFHCFILDFLMGLGIPFTFMTIKKGSPFTVCIDQNTKTNLEQFKLHHHNILSFFVFVL